MNADQQPEVCALFVAVAEWIVSTGARRIDQLPGLWRGETSEWKVTFNPRNREVDGFGPAEMQLEHKTRVAFAALDPASGVIAGSDEAEITAHFKADAETNAKAEAQG